MSEFAKERAIRERVEGLFNRPEEDFATRGEYDDYLEQREDLIFNLVEGIDVAECEAKLSKHAAENASSIAAHAAARAERARLAERAAAKEVSRRGGGGEGDEAAAAAATDAAPPLFQQPPPMPLGPPPPEPMEVASAAAGAASNRQGDGTTTAVAIAPFGGAGAPRTPADYLSMGAASGWDARQPRLRGIAEAYTTLFAF